MKPLTIKNIPNLLSLLRLLLAVPIFILIFREDYGAVLWVVFIAGMSDGIDGWLARKLDAISYFGAVMDPLCDKVLLLSTYIALVLVGLLPWWVIFLIALRDVIIVAGGVAYYWQFGRYTMQPSLLGKATTVVQIVFALMLLTQQIYPLFSKLTMDIGLGGVILTIFLSGGQYVYIWAKKARQMRAKAKQQK
ncbi:MAG: cardiolipin synthase [Psychromonas sp.]|jgi:cardiolipin synthase|uniref:CDP-alcohol phosphatidyltransferase family protein n=1 Tax=Psychromonas sp. TaxID=1884585 RepID=UPI0039E632C1